MRLNPFRTLPNPREVWAWGMYDLANQSFQLLINTLLFGIYIKTVVAATPKEGQTAYGIMVAASTLLVVLLSPPAGAIADARAWKKEMLVGTGLGASVLTGLLVLLGPGDLAWAFVLYVAAAVLVGLGENFLGAFLPELSTPQTIGRVSATGWTMSYIGALLLLAVTWGAQNWLGWNDPQEWRWLFVLAAVWFFAGMLPSMFLLGERTPPTETAVSAVRGAFHQLGVTLKESRRYRDLRRFLLAAFVYSMGTYAVIFYAGLIGDQLGFKLKELTLLALVMALTAGCASVVTARYQDRLGHRRTVFIFLGVWVISTLALALNAAFQGDANAFWFISGGIGLGLGGIGTSSRALCGCFTPREKAGEFFGLYGMALKGAAVCGALGFGVASSRLGQTPALFLLTVFFAAGAALLLRVDDKAGVAAAGNGR